MTGVKQISINSTVLTTICDGAFAGETSLKKIKKLVIKAGNKKVKVR